MAAEKLLDADANASGYHVSEEWSNNPAYEAEGTNNEGNQTDRKMTVFSVSAGPPQPYEDAAPLPVVCPPEHGERHYSTEVIQTQNISSSQESVGSSEKDSTNTDDILDFMCCNIFAGLCCCWPIGLIGIIFSNSCRSAKSEGKRKEAKCYSVKAGVLFLSSVIVGIILVIVLVITQQA